MPSATMLALGCSKGAAVTIQETNVVTPLRPAKAKRADNTTALRQRRSRAKRKPSVTAQAAKPVQISGLEKANEIKGDVTVARDDARAVTAPSRRTNYALVVIAYRFFALGIGINTWNATMGGALNDMVLPAALGGLAESVVFFLPAWALTLPIGRQMLAWALFAFISVFALTNSLRMASIIAADQATARADRQTEGVKVADHALELARGKRDEACGRGLGKTVACKVRQSEVAKLEAGQTQATAKVAAQARPESTDFAKLVTWVSRGAIQPGADDFAMLWLLFRTFLPQVGGLVLMLAQRSGVVPESELSDTSGR
jgi:hypothetical protein